ncbi:MAG: cytochrome C [Desulfuromonadales bacterium]|nr:cytochrome C [Desulfuromonadales bacterium]
MKHPWLVFTLLLALAAVPAIVLGAPLTDQEQLGKELFFDKRLSSPGGQSCADCHGATVGFTGPKPIFNQDGGVYPGAVRERFGNRKPPTAAYGGASPNFHYDADEELFVGGMFWDGRATGDVAGSPLADQAMGPFLNPVEQNNASEEAVCGKVAKGPYVRLYEKVFGPLDCVTYTADGHLQSYKNFAVAIAAYESSIEVSPYTAKFDYVMAGEAEFTPQEQLGWDVFNNQGLCAECHPGGGFADFTDFTYDNLGLPKNPANPFYRMDTVFLDDGTPINPEGAAWVDPGLAGFLDGLPESYFTELGLTKADTVSGAEGKHKVPTLRNVDKRPGPGFVKAFGHNGYFTSLQGIVHFYNTRDIKEECAEPLAMEEALPQNCWPAPEVGANLNINELGDLGLSEEEEAALVAFMGTLSDGYRPVGKGKK